MPRRLLFGFLSLVLVSFAPYAQIPVEKAGLTTLADHAGKNWFWVGGNRAPSQIDGRFFLFDEQGTLLGQLNNGFWPSSILPAKQGDDIYAAEIYFSRGLRGERTDVVTVYDGKTLLAKREITIPPKRMTALGADGLQTLSDDGRFMLIFNYTPAQSLSIIDMTSNRFTAEIETPGCATVFAAGNRDFYLLCGDGGLLHLRLGDNGQATLKERVAPLFDPINDFVSTAPSRNGNIWHFISRQQNVYAIEMTPAGAKLSAKWSLVTDGERKKDWRYSGIQHTAIHRATNRFYVLMHRGEDKTLQEPGTEVWVYDLTTQKKINTISMKEETLSIAVSQAETPKLYTVDYIVPMPFLAKIWVYLTEGQDGIYRVLQQAVSIYDTGSGKRLQHVRGLPPGHLSTIVPW